MGRGRIDAGRGEDASAPKDPTRYRRGPTQYPAPMPGDNRATQVLKIWVKRRLHDRDLSHCIPKDRFPRGALSEAKDESLESLVAALRAWLSNVPGCEDALGIPENLTSRSYQTSRWWKENVESEKELSSLLGNAEVSSIISYALGSPDDDARDPSVDKTAGGHSTGPETPPHVLALALASPIPEPNTLAPPCTRSSAHVRSSATLATAGNEKPFNWRLPHSDVVTIVLRCLDLSRYEHQFSHEYPGLRGLIELLLEEPSSPDFIEFMHGVGLGRAERSNLTKWMNRAKAAAGNLSSPPEETQERALLISGLVGALKSYYNVHLHRIPDIEIKPLEENFHEYFRLRIGGPDLKAPTDPKLRENKRVALEEQLKKLVPSGSVERLDDGSIILVCTCSADEQMQLPSALRSLAGDGARFAGSKVTELEGVRGPKVDAHGILVHANPEAVDALSRLGWLCGTLEPQSGRGLPNLTMNLTEQAASSNSSSRNISPPRIDVSVNLRSTYVAPCAKRNASTPDDCASIIAKSEISEATTGLQSFEEDERCASTAQRSAVIKRKMHEINAQMNAKPRTNQAKKKKQDAESWGLETELAHLEMDLEVAQSTRKYYGEASGRHSALAHVSSMGLDSAQVKRLDTLGPGGRPSFDEAPWP